jgi:transcriptional regulator with XRE-family HTH domain
MEAMSSNAARSLVDPVALGSQIASRRKRHGWTQRELCQRTGLDPSRLSKLERGVTLPLLTEVLTFQQVFETSLDELVLGAPAPTDAYLLRRLEGLTTVPEQELLRKLLQALVVGLHRQGEAPE